MTTTRAIAILAVVACCTASTAFAGGMPDEEADQQMPSKAIVGYVKDVSGNVIADAKVVVTFKVGNTDLITRTDATGHFRIPGFSKDADIGSVEIACSKTGFHQTGSLKRPPPGASATAPIEIDCVLTPG